MLWRGEFEMIQPNPARSELPLKLWIYTNYHCNLACSYCVAESTPQASRRVVSLDFVQRLVEEAEALGFEHFYFTGGEPFLLDEIYEMLAYASQRAPTTVLTNAMLFKGRRLEQLEQIRNERLIVQVSLDGSRPEQHDPYRGAGSWQKTVEGLRRLLERGFQVRISTTETPANTGHLDEICAYHLSLGIPEEDHFIRPLARRGFSQQGMEVCKANLAPELTVNDRGVYWHPLSTDPDMLVSEQVFPLAEVVEKAQAELRTLLNASQAEMNTFQ
jgi:MoaA/NifB/PqqE/SkfB family radical SAM enzyme